MMGKIQKVFIFIAFSACMAFLPPVAALKCYTCTSPQANNCRDISQMMTMHCESLGGNFLGAKYVCLKTERDVNGSPLVMKSCQLQGGVMNPCTGYMQEAFEHCSTCDTDMCNASSHFKSSSLLTGAVAALLISLTYSLAL